MKDRNRLTADKMLRAQEAYDRTVDRERYIVQQGYQLESIWECQLNRELRVDVVMRQFFNDVPIVEPLNPRDGTFMQIKFFYDFSSSVVGFRFIPAFFGGRTNAIKLFHQIKKSAAGVPLEHIQYTDICSLYPYINKYRIFSVYIL